MRRGSVIAVAPWVATVTSGHLLLYRGGSASGLPAPVIVDAGSSPFGMALGDFDEDGRLDIAVANQGSGDVSVLLNRCVP